MGHVNAHTPFRAEHVCFTAVVGTHLLMYVSSFMHRWNVFCIRSPVKIHMLRRNKLCLIPDSCVQKCRLDTESEDLHKLSKHQLAFCHQTSAVVILPHLEPQMRSGCSGTSMMVSKKCLFNESGDLFVVSTTLCCLSYRNTI